ncbi:platelet glycoprotein V [Suncus etruscus]|uniref:platelet glycoprotein V n=1 Tax=Suncus etruscus TaxID=109475 RepID=UPI00210F2408|nr:platelet glycoprotein V [Suncus etruscus]
MLRAALPLLLPLLLLLLDPARSQPFPCPAFCACTFRDAAQCSGVGVAQIPALGLPANLTHLVLHSLRPGTLRDDSFRGMTVLQRLILVDSPVARVAPGAFDDLRRLKTLRLSRDGLVQLPRGLLARLEQLEQLFLDRNALRSLEPDAFAPLARLQELSLSHNRLSALPAALFAGLGRLRALDLSANALAHLPPGLFGALGRLERLALHDNQLAALDAGLLRALRSLRALHLHRNRLQAVAPRAFDGLASLGNLTLQENRLRALPPALFLPARGLEELRLERNQLQALPGDAFAALPRLRLVLLGHNPWRCDCGLWPFLGWLQRHPQLLGPAEPPKCHGPAPHAGLPLLGVLPALGAACSGSPGTPSPRPATHPLSVPGPPSPPAREPTPGPAEPWAWAQSVALEQKRDHSLFFALYFLLWVSQAVVTGIIVFTMVKLGRLFRKAIQERALF